jgi:formylglycine-generating enzyme required for sulfatase activity
MLSVSGSAERRPTERVRPAPQCNPNAVVWRTPEPPPNPQKGDIWISPKDGMQMVYIPPGEFIMGSSDAEIESWLKENPGDERDYYLDEQPQFSIDLEGFWMGRTEVTNAQYQRFVAATGHPAPKHWERGLIPPGLEQFPVVNVSWADAVAYCEWAGARLPTELEWEKAARGSDRRTFPWGFTWAEGRCRYFGSHMARMKKGEPTDPVRDGPAAVGSYPKGASPYGCLDMAGNLWEWCADWYDGRAYDRYASGDPASPVSGTLRVVRGGSWMAVERMAQYRCADRYANGPVNWLPHYGFRCAHNMGR